MQLTKIVETSAAVAATRSRLKKRALIGDCLRIAEAEEMSLAVNYLGGTLPQGRLGLGPALVRAVAVETEATEAPLSLEDTDRAFTAMAGIAGKGSQRARREALGALFSRATGDERSFLIRLMLGELRQGALEGVLIEGIAEASHIPVALVRRAVMLAADPAPVAVAALTERPGGLSRFCLQPLSPVKPMLAQSAENTDDAMASLGEAALEYKLDGARVQIHRVGTEVRIFTRRQHDITGSLPEIVEAILALPSSRLILDGEVIALRETGRPHPFQVTMRRFGRKTDVAAMREQLPLDVFFFDCLHRDDEDLIDQPFRDRFSALADATGGRLLIRHTITDAPGAAVDFLANALEEGHEGIMAKSLDSTYAAGSRGADWLKIKQAHSLDLVILAAEWGSGRRKGWLSNLHLGARDPQNGTFVMLGKTFKGLTDKMLHWQTERLLELEIGREDHVVHVRPELVAEIAVNEIQASPQYPAGMALRFARVKRYRDDKTASEADVVDTVRNLFARQTGVAA